MRGRTGWPTRARRTRVWSSSTRATRMRARCSRSSVPSRGSIARMDKKSAVLRLSLFLTPLCSGGALAADPVPSGPTVAADMVVEDKAGKPVVDLKRSEVAVFQGEERQELTVFRPLETPGQYEVQYVPRSGQPGAMSVGLLRRDTRVRGLTTPALQPLILRPPTVLEAQLESLLET